MHTDKLELVNSRAAGLVAQVAERKNSLRGSMAAGLVVSPRRCGDSAVHRYQRTAIVAWLFLPAAGTRNNASFNNQGSNGNYWSSTLNAGSPNNARRLNFNSTEANVNNNNRYNGFSVRAVLSTCHLLRTRVHPFYVKMKN
jgi:hypothetical protein